MFLRICPHLFQVGNTQQAKSAVLMILKQESLFCQCVIVESRHNQDINKTDKGAMSGSSDFYFAKLFSTALIASTAELVMPPV